MIKNSLKKLELKDKLLALIVPLLLLAAWQSAVSLELCSPLLLIPPLTLLDTLLYLADSGELTINIIASLNRVLVGFLIGGLSGFLLGLFMGLSPFLDRFAGPLIKASKQVPQFALMPLIILWFGVDELAKYVFIAIGAFYPMVFNTYQGVSTVSKRYRELARVFDYRGARFLTKVILPSAMPSIITGVRHSLGLSWMFVVGAEIFGADTGLGYMMAAARNMFQIDIVMAGLVVIGAIGFSINFILQVIEKRLLVWRFSSDQGASK
ncbi:MAG: ABC transporter permease [Chlorobiaceae bacterium]|nr:ABC transporter permease [Chlorobiaceae bacterium]